ncbi:hypothetical protein S7711_00289 [Stachybotrys chartarum IBT 7711]|uniref:Zn(2)-C6 fungal-type domain-containing protein n=1 Tax=Stachybotrys chartarum (strain CBS 109288 / IBT 7711) TaxID=1280523 RepID=A0A084B412_STACB|nr:hypothetical protein S7711_00289 [Stachybotrys chartarum IBT 7711]
MHPVPPSALSPSATSPTHVPVAGADATTAADSAMVVNTTTSGPTPKLRDSCLSCSSSKVRCPRERPACSRCVKRKVQCQYAISRRAGRKHDVSQDMNNASRSNGMGIMTTANVQSMAEMPPMYPQMPMMANNTLNGIPDFLTALRSYSFDSLATMAIPLDQEFAPTLGIPEREAGTTPPAERAPALPRSLSVDVNQMHDISSFDLEEPPPTDIVLHDIMNFSSNTDHDSLSTLSFTPSALMQDITSQDHTSNHQRSMSLDSTTPELRNATESDAGKPKGNDDDCCLVRLGTIIQRLFSHNVVAAPHSGDDADIRPEDAFILGRNKEAIAIIQEVLSCSCSDDIHLLGMLAQIMAKVLGWYAIVARRTSLILPPAGTKASSQADSGISIGSSASSSGSPSRVTSGVTMSLTTERARWRNEEVASKDLGRTAAQLVLSQLYPIRHLITDLSTKLEARAAAQRIDMSIDLQGGTVDDRPFVPFSDVMLDQLAAELKDRLRILSVGTVRSLRNN